MSSWVRYSVAVYLGLLISGALARQPWAGPSPEPAIAPRVYHDINPPAPSHPSDNAPTTRTDVSV